MVQGYKTSNSTGTSRRTTGNGGQSPKGSVLFSYSGKKEEYGTLSCKDDDSYEDGSRGRKVLKGILKDRQVKALQSDGYNVYM